MNDLGYIGGGVGVFVASLTGWLDQFDSVIRSMILLGTLLIVTARAVIVWRRALAKKINGGKK